MPAVQSPESTSTLSYASRVDNLAPLYADIAYRADGKPKPLVAVLHGFYGSRQAVAPDCQALATHGLFCVAPDMRGHGDSAGDPDVGILQISDIVDALRSAALACPTEIDLTRIGAIGYSGGGGNVQNLMAKFPDLLSVGASFFGISDYAVWHRGRGRPDCNERLEQWLGHPDDVPEIYAAASPLPGLVNAPSNARLHLYWDQEETACPPILNEAILRQCEKAGRPTVVPHTSGPGDPYRWHHGYRGDNPDLAKADSSRAAALENAQPIALPQAGELDICGYVVTRELSLWLGDGTAGHCRVRYKVQNDQAHATSRSSTALREGPMLLDWLPAKPASPPC